MLAQRSSKSRHKHKVTQDILIQRGQFKAPTRALPIVEAVIRQPKYEMNFAVAGQRRQHEYDVKPSHDKATREGLFQIEWPDPEGALAAANAGVSYRFRG